MCSELCKERLGCEQSYAAVLAERKQMLPVACDEDVCAGFDSTGEDDVIASISRDRDGLVGQRGLDGGNPFEKPSDVAGAISVEAQLFGQHSIELVENGCRDEELQPAVDRLFENTARWSAGDERRDENVGVAENAGEAQADPPRSSSTSASVSSGPTPRFSAFRRP